MSSINYKGLIESLPDEAFKKYRDVIYVYLHYKVMLLTEVRRIDIIERLIETDRTSITGKGISFDNYVSEIKKYLDNYVTCVSGSRAEKYLIKATNIINDIEKGKGNTGNRSLADLTKLFVCILRESLVASNEGISTLRFAVSKDDYDFLDKLRTLKLKSKKKVSVNAPSQSNKEKEWLFVNSSLFLTMILSEEGQFLTEEA